MGLELLTRSYTSATVLAQKPVGARQTFIWLSLLKKLPLEIIVIHLLKFRLHSRIAYIGGGSWAKLWYLLRALDTSGGGYVAVDLWEIRTIFNRRSPDTIYKWLEKGETIGAFRWWQVRGETLYCHLGSLEAVTRGLDLPEIPGSKMPRWGVTAEVSLFALLSLRSWAVALETIHQQNLSRIAARATLRVEEDERKLASVQELLKAKPAGNYKRSGEKIKPKLRPRQPEKAQDSAQNRQSSPPPKHPTIPTEMEKQLRPHAYEENQHQHELSREQKQALRLFYEMAGLAVPDYLLSSSPPPGGCEGTNRVIGIYQAKYCKIHPGTKRPIGTNWNNRPYELSAIRPGLDKGEHGYGILLGYGNLVAIDIDSLDGLEAYREIFGHLPHEASTVSWTSGKRFNGKFSETIDAGSRIQVLYRLTDSQAEQLLDKKFSGKTGLEVRWKGKQSVLPSSQPHPETGKPYRWHHAPDRWAVAPLPDEALVQLIEREAPPGASPDAAPGDNTTSKPKPKMRSPQAGETQNKGRSHSHSERGATAQPTSEYGIRTISQKKIYVLPNFVGFGASQERITNQFDALHCDAAQTTTRTIQTHQKKILVGKQVVRQTSIPESMAPQARKELGVGIFKMWGKTWVTEPNIYLLPKPIKFKSMSFRGQQFNKKALSIGGGQPENWFV
ncbi:MAG TPA: bifunctional DNA primase/polymerase [Kamptonema sp.]|nr:bifunctional DNA primase/polymerase [Kamptonema sp.]